MNEPLQGLQWHESADWIRLRMEYVAYTQHGRYNITFDDRRKTSSWHVTRSNHSLMPSFDGWCNSVEDAKRECERDFIALSRADRWLDYMRENEPPVND